MKRALVCTDGIIGKVDASSPVESRIRPRICRLEAPRENATMKFVGATAWDNALYYALTPDLHSESLEELAVKLEIHLSDQEAEGLRSLAEHIHLSVTDCARALLVDQLDRPAEDFDVCAARVLETNAELYGRLS